jgi:sugar diacid utilization regulator
VAESLQALVDGLAADIRRGVAIDDPSLELLAHSPHYEAVDPARQESILTRRVPDETRAWALGLGIAEETGPVRIPANPQLGSEARVCVPIRAAGRLLGFLLVIDRDGSVGDSDLARLSEGAEAAASILHREHLEQELARGRERELLRDLLFDDARVSERAARLMLDEGRIGMGHPIAVLAISVASSSDEVDVRIAQALERLRRSVPLRSGVGLARAGHGVFVASGYTMDAAKRLGERLRGYAGEALDADAAVRVGIASPVAELTEVRTAYRRALETLQILKTTSSFPDVMHWNDLGVYRILAKFPTEDSLEELHPGLAALLEARGAATLLNTLETYLDLTGNVQATASRLNLHRTSLYYRLGRIEEITGARLRRGEDRLALHMALKLAKISGLT